MSETLKVLGQLNPSATTLTTLYTATSTVSVSSLIVCNQGIAGSFRISIQVAAEADNPKQYLYYDVPIMPNDSFIATVGITLGDTDVVKVYASHANMSFNLFGIEV